MSQKEFERLKVIENAVGGRLSVSEAAALLQLSERKMGRVCAEQDLPRPARTQLHCRVCNESSYFVPLPFCLEFTNFLLIHVVHWHLCKYSGVIS
jgi:hypothetical protein